MSPLVFCGPQGLSFKKPVELILPHSPDNALVSNEALRDSPSLLHLSLRASQTKSGKPTAWKNVDLGERFLSTGLMDAALNRGGGKVSVLVDHF